METIDSHKGSRLLRSWLWKQLTVTREVDCYVLGYGKKWQSQGKSIVTCMVTETIDSHKGSMYKRNKLFLGVKHNSIL